MMHTETHPQADETVKVVLRAKHPQLEGLEHEFVVEDWWDKLTGKSWMYSDGNPAALFYAMRAGVGNFPFDDEVIYGKIGGFGFLVHSSEMPDGE